MENDSNDDDDTSHQNKKRATGRDIILNTKKKKQDASSSAAVGNITTSPSSSSTREQQAIAILPSVVWTKVVNLLPFEDVLSLISCNRSLRNDIPPLLSRIFVMKPETLNISNVSSSSFLERFIGIEQVYFYCLVQPMRGRLERIRSNGGPPGYRIMYTIVTTPKRKFITFLTQFPLLKYVYFGGMMEPPRQGSDRTTQDGSCRIDIMTDEIMDYYDAEDDDDRMDFCRNEMRNLIRYTYSAIQSGSLSSSSLILEGIVPERDISGDAGMTEDVSDEEIPGMLCWWNDGHERIPICRLCRLMCYSFPPQMVFKFSNGQINCVTQERRMEIAKERDPIAIDAAFIDAELIRVMYSHATACMLVPNNRGNDDDDEEKEEQEERLIKRSDTCYAAEWDDDQLERMSLLIQYGANVRHPTIRRILTDKTVVEPWSGKLQNGWNVELEKRCITDVSFHHFLQIGLDVQEDDFILCSEYFGVILRNVNPRDRQLARN